MAETTKNYVVLNGRKVELFYGDKIKVMGNENAEAYYIEITNASSAENSSDEELYNAMTNAVVTGDITAVGDMLADAALKKYEEEVIDEEDKYRKGVNYLVNMIEENPSDFLNLSTACVGNIYPNFLNPAIAGLNARDCEKMAVSEFSEFIGESLCNRVIDIMFSEIDNKTKSDILSFLVNAKMAMNDNNIENIIKMTEKYLSVVITTVFANNAQ